MMPTSANHECAPLRSAGTAVLFLETPSARRAFRKSVSAFFFRGLARLAVCSRRSNALSAAVAASLSMPSAPAQFMTSMACATDSAQ